MLASRAFSHASTSFCQPPTIADLLRRKISERDAVEKAEETEQAKPKREPRAQS
jgi:hypothetical protein